MKLEEGYTFNYVIHGIACIVIGLIMIYANLFNFDVGNQLIASNIGWGNVITGGVIIVIGILFLLVKTGIELNTEKREVRAYQSLFKLTYGNWINASNMQKAFISLNKGYYERANFGGARTHRVLTFDLILVDRFDCKTKIYSFSKRKVAFQTLDELHKYLGIQPDKRIRSGKLT